MTLAPVAERQFRAMGCDVHLVVGGPAGLLAPALDQAAARIEQLEARWSRFRPTSELCQLNAAGTVSGLSADTYTVIEEAIEAWRATDARFDPTIADALVAAGYDRSFDQLVDAAPSHHGAGPQGTPPPGPVGITFEPETSTVSLPEGVHLDLGGIGKGRAADIVSRELLALGLTGVCVNLGGDVRVRGVNPYGGPWVVAVEDSFAPPTDLTCVVFDEGAVATSSRLRRTWAVDGATRHHLIDPATGVPASRGVAAVTVVAADAQWAEVLAKAAFVAGPDAGAELIADAGAVGLLVEDDRTVRRTPGFERFEQTSSVVPTVEEEP